MALSASGLCERIRGLRPPLAKKIPRLFTPFILRAEELALFRKV